MTAPGSSRRSERRYEDLQREIHALRKLYEATRSELDELRSVIPAEPFLDKQGVVEQYSVGKRTVEKWIAEGMPMELLNGKRKGRLSKIDAWLVERGYVPRRERVDVPVRETH